MVLIWDDHMSNTQRKATLGHYRKSIHGGVWFYSLNLSGQWTIKCTVLEWKKKCPSYLLEKCSTLKDIHAIILYIHTKLVTIYVKAAVVPGPDDPRYLPGLTQTYWKRQIYELVTPRHHSCSKIWIIQARAFDSCSSSLQTLGPPLC